MRSTRLTVAAATVLLTAACAGTPTESAQPEPSWSVPCPSPSDTRATDFADLALPCLDGGDGEYPVGAVDDRPVVITLWASWCKPCANEAPVIEAQHQELGDEVTFLGVNTQDTQDKGRYFAEDFDWTFPSVFDPEAEVLHSQGLTVLPATFVIAPDGSTVTRFTDGTLTADELRTAIDEARETH